MAFCRHDGMQKHKIQYPKNARNTAHCWVSVVYPHDCHDCVADRELQLAATVQHHKSVWNHKMLAQEKLEIQNLKCGFY